MPRPEDTPDRHAAERERKRRKKRYGMKVTGRSVRTLARLATPKRRRMRKA